MKVYTGKGLGDIYLSVFRDLKAHGEKVTVRGNRCVEFPEPVSLVYTQPGACWMRIPGRKFNPFFALAEVVWILSGNGNVDWIANYNSKMRDFNDGGPDNHGAYGLRIRKWKGLAPGMCLGDFDEQRVDQVEHVVRKLKGDLNSRQAVISLWDPVRDNLIKSKDIPCNNLVYYKLRGHKEGIQTDVNGPGYEQYGGILDQTVVIRSNDLIWGQPYNAVQFTHLHALVAGELNADMGTLTYVIQNLHYYEDLYPETLAAIEENAACEGNPGAESVEDFGTVTDDTFKNYTCDKKKAPSGYWESTIPDALRLFNNIKLRLHSFSECAHSLAQLPEPLHWLALDFWRTSKDQFTKDVLSYEEKHIARRTIEG